MKMVSDSKRQQRGEKAKAAILGPDLPAATIERLVQIISELGSFEQHQYEPAHIFALQRRESDE